MRGLLLMGLLLLAGCGQSSGLFAAPTPVVQTVEVTRIVEVVVTATHTPTATRRPATPTPRATRTPIPTPIGGKWNVRTGTSTFDDSRRVVLSLEAERVYRTRLGFHLPTLVLRCAEQELDVYVITGTPADIERGNLDGATVRLRFDDDPAETRNTSRSTDDEALFFGNSAALIERMSQARLLQFGFTPFNSPPVETTFDLRGLPGVLPRLLDACDA
jgi:hypothetical protein